MAEFILVHGAFHGAWCWREVVPRLQARGHHAVAIDLPGHGADRSTLQTIALSDYVARIVEAVEASSRPPILVGHSMGIISQVELPPAQIRARIYLSGLLPPNGASMMQLVGGFDPGYLEQLEWAPDRRTARLSATGLRDFFYSCCPAGVAEAAYPLLTPEPAAPYDTAFSMDSPSFARIPSYYIESLRDRIMPLSMQREMCAPLPWAGVYSLDTDHAAFFSVPDELAAILDTIALRP